MAPPAPTLPLDRLDADPEGEAIGRLWIVPRRSRAVRVTITMDQQLVTRIDQCASHIGATRSGFIADGARRLLEASGARE